MVVMSVAMGRDFFLRRGSSATLSMASARRPESSTAAMMAGNSPKFRETKK